MTEERDAGTRERPPDNAGDRADCDSPSSAGGSGDLGVDSVHMTGLADLLARATPGPWTVVEYIDDFKESAKFVGFKKAAGGSPWFEEDSTVLSAENAHLIALTPNMAQLLIDMAEWIYNAGHGRRAEELLDRFAELEQRAAQ